MTKYEIFLAPKPGTRGSNIKVVIEAQSAFQAEDIAEAQYGSNYFNRGSTLA